MLGSITYACDFTIATGGRDKIELNAHKCTNFNCNSESLLQSFYTDRGIQNR